MKGIDVPSETLWRDKDLYLDANAPFQETYRNSDSTWALASPEELQSGLEWWKEIVDSGKAAETLEHCEKVRQLIG